MKVFKGIAAVFLMGNLLSVNVLAAPGPYVAKQQANNFSVEDVQRFTAAINQIKQYYVEDVDDQTLFENAIRGMLSGLDPHSSYLDIEDFSELKSHTSGEFGGLGIEITSEDGYIKIVSPIDDTPAAKSHLKPGDMIVKIDNVPVKDLSLSEAVGKMRGPQGTDVTLTIYRKSEQKVFNQKLTREIIHVQSVKNRLLEDGYGYIRISQFQLPTVKELNQAIMSLKAANKNKPLNGLVLDLRNNPGGLLDSAIEVSDAFLDSNQLKDDGLIVYTKGRIQGSKFEAHATPGDLINGAPIVVLINSGSASGSEIVAGALQDHARAVIMGTSSFGKGSVQTVLPLDDERGLKLTTALYYTPNGTSIQAKGIKPDVYVEIMDVKKFDQEDMLSFVTVKEADFDNHLDNGSASDDKSTEPSSKASSTSGQNVATQKKEVEQPLAVTDFQLYEALNLLKGLNVVSKSRVAAS